MASSIARLARASRRTALLSVAPLALAVACSAPAGSESEDDGPPPFNGSANGSSGNNSGTTTNTGGLQPSVPNNATGNITPGANGAGGSTGAEVPGANAQNPNPPPAQNAGQNNSAGAGGAPQVSNGAAGMNAGMVVGNAGSGAVPPVNQNPPPVTPPPVTPPPAANAGCANQFLCEDFEALPAGNLVKSATWDVIANYNDSTQQDPSVQVSAQQAHTGRQSLHVAANGGRSGIIASLPQTRYFMRAWLNVDAVPLGPVFIGLGTDQNSETRLRIQGQSFATINTVGPGDAVHPDQANSGNCTNCVKLVPNGWFCAEFSIDNATQNATMWINGVEAASIVNGDKGWPVQPAAPRMFLGSMAVQGGQAGVFIDDVVVGSARIFCE